MIDKITAEFCSNIVCDCDKNYVWTVKRINTGLYFYFYISELSKKLKAGFNSVEKIYVQIPE